MSFQSNRMPDRLAFVLLTILMVDCAVLGGGSVVKIFGADYRMLLFAAFFFCSLPAVFRNFKKLAVNSYLIILVLWGIWTIISAVRGYQLGNSPSHITGQLVGYAAFGMLPGTIAILSSREQILTLMKALSIASFFLFLQTLIVLLVYCADIDLFIQLNSWIIGAELGGCTGVTSTLVRIFFRSHPCMVLGCICSFYLGYTDPNPVHKDLYTANIVLSLMSLLLSYTRSLYLGAFAGAVLMLVLSLILHRKNPIVRKSIIRLTTGILVGFLAVLLIFDIAGRTQYLSYGLYRSTGVDAFNIQGDFPDMSEIPEDPTQDPGDINALSDDVREKTKEELYDRISHHSVVGSGLGAILDYRAAIDGANEYFYLDMIFTTGSIGIILFLLPMLLLVIFLIRGFRSGDPRDTGICIAWLSGFVSVAVFSIFNPYLTGVSGISIYCCAVAVFSNLNGHQQIGKKLCAGGSL